MTEMGGAPGVAPAYDPPPPFQLQVGDVLGTSIKVLTANAVPFFLLAFLVQLPSILREVWVELYPPQLVDVGYNTFTPNFGGIAASAAGTFAALILMLLVTNVAKATMIYGTVEQLAGRHAPMGASVSKGFSRFFPVIGTAILTGILYFFGLMACVVPGILLMLMFYVAVPATVVERLGPIEAMKRSSDLTDGHKGTIFLCLLIVWVAFFVMGVVVTAVLGAGTFTAIRQQSYDAIPATLGWTKWALLAATTIIETLGTAVGAVVCAVIYARLRSMKDGVDANALAEVFR